MPKAIILIDLKSGLKEEFESLTEAAQFIKLTGISNSKLKSIITNISDNLNGKHNVSFGSYQFRFK